MKTFLAVDIGASGGRHMLGWISENRLHMEEVYRFDNRMFYRDGHLYWDTEYLFEQILNGMRQCRKLGKTPDGMAVDTWGVDFVFLDKEGRRLGSAVGYRDRRTKGMDDKVQEVLSEQELYYRTGIQKQMFNTIYQLMAVKEQEPKLLEKAWDMLLMPDYFHYLLTGEKTAEYTNATTTQLVSVKTGEWDMELIKRLGFPEWIFGTIRKPGSILGELTKKVQRMVGFNCKVILPATHDTGSAVLAMPCPGETGLYISSGTWSLMGTEMREAVCTLEAMEKNLTNEGGYCRRYRLLKNIMGLWMIQSIRHEENNRYSFAHICEQAEESYTFPSRVDVNDAVFMAPDSMKEAIRQYCKKTGQQVPDTLGEIAAVIYQSLAECYGRTAEEIEEISGKAFDCIYILGGGSNADYLNQITADAAGRRVSAGPSEATAIGNLAVQMIAAGIFKNLGEARECIARSFPIKIFEPRRQKS